MTAAIATAIVPVIASFHQIDLRGWQLTLFSVPGGW
jgi:hypothetical protein